MDSDSVKLITIGSSAVGKTTLRTSYSGEYTNATHISTIGVDFQHTTRQIFNRSIEVKMFDTAG